MKRALAAGAVGLGLGSTGAAISADDAERDGDDVNHAGDDTGQDDERVHPELVLVFADDYHPEISFRPIDRLPQRPVNEILGYQVGEGNPVVSNPTDYNGYVIVCQPDLPGEYTFAFVNRRTLQQDQRYQFTDNVVFFSTPLNLVSASITTANSAEETATAETTTTPGNETTQEVIVETTETNRDE